MAELVAVRHSTQDASEDSGLMSREYLERFGRDKGYVEVDDEASVAAARAASGQDAAPSVDELDALTKDELRERLPDGADPPASATKAELIALIRGAG